MGILIWECVSGSFPFGCSQEVIEGPKAAELRQLTAQGSLPWKEYVQEDLLLKQVAKLVDRCCNLKPNIRPSAADVAHSLFDILTLTTINIDPSPPLDEGVKVRVSQLLDEVDKTRSLVIPNKLDAKSVQDLRNLVAYGDPTAALLLGSAIWYSLADPDEDLDQLLLVAGEDHSHWEGEHLHAIPVNLKDLSLITDTELRARAALRHLEFAFQAGVKAAAEPLMRVHGALMTSYRKQALQYKSMQSL